MQIGPNADQLALRNSMRAVLAAECPLSLTRASYTDSQAWHPLWHKAVELSWTWLARRGSDDDEDPGLGTLDLVLALEACGAVLAPLPLLSSVGLAAGALRAGGAALTEVLAEIADGHVATLAVQPATQRLPGVCMSLRDGRVRGTAVAVPDVEHARLVVVLCDNGDTVSVAALRPGDGVLVEPADSADPSRQLATLIVDAPI
ncbi:hypothetical protein [Mycobacterium sp.]|uniref:hypothetical protein n=1 Tax=Mycobacterium sp. TaxID=1785 RepID=UPI003D111241